MKGSFLAILAYIVILGQCFAADASTADKQFYILVKKVIQQRFLQDKELAGRPNASEKEDKLLHLDTCMFGNEALFGMEDGDDKTFKLKELAFEVVNFSTALSSAGYPKDVWATPISQFEQKNLIAISNDKESAMYFDHDSSKPLPLLTSLAKNATTYRKANPGRQLIKVTDKSPGCGAGEMTVTITTKPKAKRIQYINAVNFDICHLQGKKDYDTESCKTWTDYSISKNSGAQMAGNYKIVVTWADNTTITRTVKVEELPGAENLEARFEIHK
ncbi:hypothetical protein HFO33_31505 [Rhizobium leguminosarum]|uniref:hypothetical protein n=1 Tax=Rhizobium leguminosarum TaxID=384 RepID=UPI0014420D66|nr:hypothetical protein [Rhizobium leguminosarum]MBY5721045.1 hypothetical protein [Rhizobium leguminosarum]NKL84510.1 hypothetical protein [Rhizobium leguminosarum bv. viciae]